MQLKTFLGLFCTIIVLLIEANNGAAVVRKVVTEPKPVPPPEKKPEIRGGRTAWATKIPAKDKKLFNDYKKIISKKLQEVHKVPAKFVPKPVKYASQIVSGTLHHYLVKLPVNKYAYITIVNQGWKKADYGKTEHVTVRPQLYELNDKNI